MRASCAMSLRAIIAVVGLVRLVISAKMAKGTNSAPTPVARVVGLLKDMQATLTKDLQEDEALYKKLACWCSNTEGEKDAAISSAEAKMTQLDSDIEQMTARSSGLASTIKELEADLAANKQALAEANAQREKQQTEAHGAELDSIQAVENLKAAIEILSKHHSTAFPEVSMSLLAVGGQGKRWAHGDDAVHLEKSLDYFMSVNGLSPDGSDLVSTKIPRDKFLQQDSAPSENAAGLHAWSPKEVAVVRKALNTMNAFVQSHQGETYYPAYKAQSGEILGVLKQLKEEMENNLSDAQKTENERAELFQKLRDAKMAEIEAGEKMAEEKEDELATTNNNLAEAKEDLVQEKSALSEHQAFMINLKKTCAEGDSNYETRRKARLEEIRAVAETIGILLKDEARDTVSKTYAFVQVSQNDARLTQQRKDAAVSLRKAAVKSRSPQLSVLATTVELDSFERVQKAIDDMVAMLKVQQQDEVKKNDWCKSEFQENEMTTMKTEDHKSNLEAKAADLTSAIQSLAEGIQDAKVQISQLQLDLQRASEDRKAENVEFQKTVSEQRETASILKQALERLAKYYEQESLFQRGSRAMRYGVDSHRQTPPVPQAEYQPSSSAAGVLQMIEKLIHEALDLVAASKKAESEAQAAYETYVADTNGSVAALLKEVASKTKAKASAEKDKQFTESEVADRVEELSGLAKYNMNLHTECDYILRNFMARQEARAQEIEALQQAKQILNGASQS